MTSAADLKLLKERTRTLQKGGIPVELIDNPRTRVQWYKPDGTPLPNLLPGDAHHVRLWEKQGWRIGPFLTQTVSLPADPPRQYATARGSHQHRFNRAVGSPCKVEDCTAVRQIAWRKKQK